ncbi:MAG: phage tail assembly protein [Synergistales bacterium]|nr:phage tail assembly protein [Synergistales bacterium]
MTTEIKLDHPLTIDGKTVESLTLRRPKVKDQRNAEKAAADPGGQELALFGALTGINPEDLEELDMKDYGKLQEAYGDFLS